MPDDPDDRGRVARSEEKRVYAAYTLTVLADDGERYMSKLFNPEFLREKGLPVPPWLDSGEA